MVKSSLCDYSDARILVKETITIASISPPVEVVLFKKQKEVVITSPKKQYLKTADY